LRLLARHPTQVPPLAALSAVLPRGRGSLEPLRRMVGRVAPVALPAGPGQASVGLPAGAGDAPWPSQPRVWVVAMDYAGGRRVAFGRDGAPMATLAQAVTASCAIP